MNVPIPLFAEIEQIAHHDDDRIEHRLSVGVNGMTGSPLAATIESDFFEWPRTTLVEEFSAIDLPPLIRNLLIFKCFEVLVEQLDGTDIASWYIPDARRWIETQFLTTEAEIILCELSRQIYPAVNL